MQEASNLTTLCIWIPEQRLGGIVIKANTIYSYKGHEVVERHDLEEPRHVEGEYANSHFFQTAHPHRLNISWYKCFNSINDHHPTNTLTVDVLILLCHFGVIKTDFGY